MTPNPFLTYRERLDSYEVVRSGTMSDERFVDIVSGLDEAVAGVAGHGFAPTPLVDGTELAALAGLDVDLIVKAELHTVGGSHKARHLMGVAIAMLVGEALGAPAPERLAIASCGNAAIAASIIARALDRPLQVFVPMWAEASVIDTLDDLQAVIHRCERREGEAGDPCYLRFREDVAAGAVAFAVQGTDTPTTFDGGRTLGWELADQTAEGGGLDAVYVQVGGGALATSVSMGLGPGVRLHPVQAEGCAPLRRAWDLLAPDFDPTTAAADPDAFMTPWAEPSSLATGILDDITYDWQPLTQLTRASGGWPIVAPESSIERAHQLARAATDLPVSATGTAGLAGLLAEPPATKQRVAVLFTGIER